VRHPVGVNGLETLGLLGRASRIGYVDAGGGVAAPSGMFGKGGSGNSSCCAGDIWLYSCVMFVLASWTLLPAVRGLITLKAGCPVFGKAVEVGITPVARILGTPTAQRIRPAATTSVL